MIAREKSGRSLMKVDTAFLDTSDFKLPNKNLNGFDNIISFFCYNQIEWG